MSDDNGADGGSTGFGNSFTQVTEQSWLGQLAGSFFAVIFGIVLFFASFVLLYWNEGRAVVAIDSLNAGAHMVVSVPEGTVNPANQGHLVHVSGTVAVGRAAADPMFHITLAGAVRLQRSVSMYQWKETEHTETQKNVGGSQTTRTTYSYAKVWSASAIDSSDFKHPDGHANPVMTLHSGVFNADGVKIGAFRLESSLLQKLSGFETLAPPDTATGAGTNPSFRREGEQFYHGASPQSPAIGDMQVSFEVIKSQPVSVIAAQLGDTLAPFRGNDGRVIELVDLGTRDAGSMFQEAKSQASTLTWILRGVGFVMMVIGITLMAAPLAWLASVLPFLEGVVDAAAFFVGLVLAIPLTLATIAIAWVAHRPLLGVGLLIVGVAAAFGLHRLVRRRRPPAGPMTGVAPPGWHA
jgi:hypothetical protein